MADEFLNRAIILAKQSIDNGGGPFGAVIVQDNQIIAEGNNRVTPDCDPTAHAEVVAIRRAAQAIENYMLEGCTLYTSSEPCPMCLAAIYWARIERVIYANPHQQAASAGFDDSLIYQQLNLPHADKQILIQQSSEKECLIAAEEIFQLWGAKQDKVLY